MDRHALDLEELFEDHNVGSFTSRSVSSTQPTCSSAPTEYHLQQRRSQTDSGEPGFYTPSPTGSHYQVGLANSHCRSWTWRKGGPIGWVRKVPSQTCWQ